MHLINDIKQLKLNSGNFKLLFSLLTYIPGKEAEAYLINAAQDDKILLASYAVKELAYRAEKILIQPANKLEIRKAITDTYSKILDLESMLTQHQQDAFLVHELKSRLLMAKKNFLYWLAIYSRPVEVKGIINILLGDSKAEKAHAAEWLISILQEETLTAAIMQIFFAETPRMNTQIQLETEVSIVDDWLKKVIHYSKTPFEGKVMDDMQKIYTLREVELFKQLPGEILLVIAQETQVQDVAAGEVIFAEGGPPTGLYMIASGKVKIEKNKQVLTTLNENAFFGELALLDNSTRAASAIAETDGVLLFMEKDYL